MYREDKRMVNDYEIIHSFYIGDREVVLGDNPNAPPGQRFMCALCQYMDILAGYTEVLLSDDYAEIVKIYADRLSVQAEKARELITVPQRKGIDTRVITKADCHPITHEDDIRNKIVVVNAKALRREYQASVYQLMLCESGFGASPNSRGNACFCIDLYTGEQCRQERPNILGTLNRSQLPQWAEQTLRQYEKRQKAERRNDAR